MTLMNSPTVKTVWLVVLGSFLTVLAAHAVEQFTQVSITNGRWHLNGELTYRGANAEGLLLNIRVVNAILEWNNE